MIDEVSGEAVVEFPSTAQQHPLPPAWKTTAEVAFGCFFLIAAASFFVAKRRSVVLQQQQTTISIQVEAEPLVPYEQLRCTTTDQRLIYDVISPLNRDSWWTLLRNKGTLDGLGNRIRETLHPFKFLETIFLHSELLRPTVQTIFASGDLISGYKQTEFLDGVAWGMAKEGRRGQVLCYVGDFARKMGLDATRVRSFTQSQDWKGLVRYLCTDSKVPPKDPQPSLALQV